MAIRVAMVSGPSLPEHDGVSDYVAHLRDALRQEGVDVVPVTLAPTGSGGWVAGAAAAARRVRDAAAHVVHVQFAPASYRFSLGPAVAPLLLPRDVPLVTTLHEYGWWARPSWVPAPAWRVAERARVWDRETGRLVPASRTVIAGNPGHAAAVRHRVGLCPVEVPIAANIDVHPRSDARHALRDRFGLPPEAPVAVFFGFVHPVKGIRYAIEALDLLRAEHPDLHLLVVGGFTSQALPADEAGRFREELVRYAADRGVGDRVVLTGRLDDVDVSSALQAADVGVLPFTAGVTTKSGALLSMLAHGLPVAATVPDEPEPDLRDGVEVVAIPRRRDGSAVAEAMRRVLQDPALAARVAEGGRRRAARHAWPAVARAHVQVYERLVGELR